MLHNDFDADCDLASRKMACDRKHSCLFEQSNDPRRTEYLEIAAAQCERGVGVTA